MATHRVNGGDDVHPPPIPKPTQTCIAGVDGTSVGDPKSTCNAMAFIREDTHLRQGLSVGLKLKSYERSLAPQRVGGVDWVDSRV